MKFKELAQERYSCRSFSDKKVPQDMVEELISIAMKAPTAKNLQPYKIFVLDSEKAKSRIKELSPCTYGADTFLVVGVQEEEAWEREFDHHSFADVDGSIVATHLMLATYALGLTTTWVGFFDAPKLQESFPEMANHRLIALFPIGYPDEKGGPSDRHFQRKSKEELVQSI